MTVEEEDVPKLLPGKFLGLNENVAEGASVEDPLKLKSGITLEAN